MAEFWPNEVIASSMSQVQIAKQGNRIEYRNDRNTRWAPQLIHVPNFITFWTEMASDVNKEAVKIGLERLKTSFELVWEVSASSVQCFEEEEMV